MGKFLATLANLPNSVTKIAFSLLILLSLGSIHYVTYAISFPAHLRVLLDATFKIDFFANFALIATFSIVVARYLPQTLLAIAAFIFSSVIGIEYYRRGYRRVASLLGLLEKVRRKDKAEKLSFERKLASFGRYDARMDNFVGRVIQRRLPILWYEEKKWVVMVPLALFLCLCFYVGILYSIWLFTFFVIVSSAYETYDGYNSAFRFSLKGYIFSGDDPSHVPTPIKLDPDRLFVIATTCAVIFAAAGPLRLSSQINETKASIVQSLLTVDAVIVGTTAHGLLVFDQQFGFVPFSAIQEIR